MNNKPIRILQYIGCLELGGSQAMIMNIYRNIDRSKIQFDFIIDKEIETPYEKEIISLGGKIYKFKYHFNGINYFQYKEQWKQFYRNHNEYKIIHSHVRSTASIVFRIAKKYSITTICHSHSTSNGRGIKAIVKKILQKKIVKYCDYYLACSKQSAKWLYGERIIESDKYLVIKNSIDVKKYEYNKSTRNRIRKSLDLRDKIIIGQIGRIEKTKNHMFSIKLLSDIVKEDNRYHLLIIGAGSLKKAIYNYAKKLCVLQNITFLENRNDINELMQAIDVYIMPSFYEGLPMTLVEAQAASLPCVISNNINAGIINKQIVKKISLDKKDEWKKQIINMATMNRKNASDIVINSGYDIKQNVETISNLYCKLNENNRRKILFCLGSMGQGGAERVIANLSNKIIEKNNVTIVTTKNTKSAYALDKRIHHISLDNETDKKNGLFLRTIKRVLKLRTILKTESPNIAISFLPEPSFRIMISKLLLKVPVIISVRNDPSIEYNTTIKKLLVRMLYSKANGFVFQTPDAKNWFSNKIQKKSVIIPNPINKQFLKEKPSEKRNKEIVTVGRLVEQKNQELLILAFKDFLNKHNDYKLKIYGDGPLEKYLAKQIIKNKLNNTVTLMGNCNDIAKAIYTASMFILSSNYEGMPNSLMEAMALGVPCISTDCPIGGPKFLIQNNINGILTKVKDKDGLVKAMELLAENQKISKSISEKAIESSKKYTEAIIYEKWNQYIETIIDSYNK